MSEQEQQDVSQVAPSTDSPSSAPEESKEGARTQAPTEQELPIEQVRQLKIRIEELEKGLAQERDKATEYMNLAMRSQADASNMRKRLQQDLARALQDMLRSVVYEQLAVLDSFDRAFASLPSEFRHFTWVEGVSISCKALARSCWSLLRILEASAWERMAKFIYSVALSRSCANPFSSSSIRILSCRTCSIGNSCSVGA